MNKNMICTKVKRNQTFVQNNKKRIENMNNLSNDDNDYAKKMNSSPCYGLKPLTFCLAINDNGNQLCKSEYIFETNESDPDPDPDPDPDQNVSCVPIGNEPELNGNEPN